AGGGTMMHLARIGAVLILAAIVASGAWAAETSVGGVPITLPAPAGFCELSADQPSDNRVQTIVSGALERTGSRLLAISADCRQLADGRAGKRLLLDDTATFATTFSAMNRVVASRKTFIQEACTGLRAQGGQLAANQAPDVKSMLEGALARVKVHSQGLVGVLAEDDTACYAAYILKGRLPNGADKTQLMLLSSTVVKSKAIAVSRHADYRDADATLDLLAKLRDTVAALYAANK